MTQMPPARILLIRPSALGDVCRTVPVVVSLRRAFPDARIDWIVQEEFVDAVRAHPEVHRVIAFPRRRFAAWYRSPSAFQSMLGWLGELRRGGYELVLDCQGLGRSGFMARVTGAPRRVGLAAARELAWLGYTVRHRTAPDLHTVDEMLSLLEPIDVEPVRDLRLYVPADAASSWARRRETMNIDRRPYAVLAPTSRWSSKRWPAERWRELMTPLRERGVSDVVLIGAPSEREQVGRAMPEADDAGVHDTCGTTSVGETMAVIAGARLIVANDSAPLHMAIGLDRPCVGLFGPTDPRRVGPYRAPESVVWKLDPSSERLPGFRDRDTGDELMRRITVDDVVSAVDRVFAARCENAAS